MKKPIPFISLGNCYVGEIARSKAAEMIRYSRRHPKAAPMSRIGSGFFTFGSTSLNTGKPFC